MSKTNTWENELLQHIFQNANVANIGDATGIRGSVAAGSLYVSLHTADPGEAADQTTSETAYSGYARIAVARTSGGWAITGNSVSPAVDIDFPACVGGTSTITHFGIGTSEIGAGKLLYKGTVSPNISVANGVIPRLTTGTVITEE